jgi:hypothetical protein
MLARLGEITNFKSHPNVQCTARNAIQVESSKRARNLRNDRINYTLPTATLRDMQTTGAFRNYDGWYYHLLHSRIHWSHQVSESSFRPNRRMSRMTSIQLKLEEVLARCLLHCRDRCASAAAYKAHSHDERENAVRSPTAWAIFGWYWFTCCKYLWFDHHSKPQRSTYRFLYNTYSSSSQHPTSLWKSVLKDACVWVVLSFTQHLMTMCMYVAGLGCHL